MKYLNILDAPIEITGLAEKSGETFMRLPLDIHDKVNAGVTGLSKQTAGGCVRFATDSKNIEVKFTLKNPIAINNMATSGSSGVDIYIGGRFAKTVYSSDINARELSGIAVPMPGLGDGVHTVECFLPLYNGITKMEIGIDDDAEFHAPPKQKYKPVCFYGSSITQGGCATKPGNSYNAFLARMLDFPQINLGFSGNGKGEQIVAEYITSLDLSVFVLDYDHNAPTLEHLKNTHKPFFDTVRRARPKLPIIIMTKPDFDRSPAANAERREVIYQTYKAAKDGGDDNVYFIDGETFFGPDTPENDRLACTVDGCHPNDLGFYRMAMTIYPVLKEVLESQ